MFDAPTDVALLGAALFVGVVAVADDAVPLSRRTVLAAGPWSAAAAGVVVAGRAGAYEAASTSVTARSLVLAVCVLAVGSWILLARAAVVRNVPFRERYLAGAGSGAAVVVYGGLLGHVGDVPASRVVWLAIVPVAAVLLAAVGYFALGLVYTDAVVAFRLAGLFAVATVVFDGVASAAAVETLGANERGVVVTLVTAPFHAAGVALSGWLAVPMCLLLGVVLVAGSSLVLRRRRRVGTGCVLATSVVSLASATVVLATAVLLG